MDRERMNCWQRQLGYGHRMNTGGKQEVSQFATIAHVEMEMVG